MESRTYIIVNPTAFFALFWLGVLGLGVGLYMLLTGLPALAERYNPGGGNVQVQQSLTIYVRPGTSYKVPTVGTLKVFESSPGKILVGHVDATLLNAVYTVRSGGVEYPVTVSFPQNPTGLLDFFHDAPCASDTSLVVKMVQVDGSFVFAAPCGTRR